RARAEDLAVMLHRRGLPTDHDLADRLAANAGTWNDREPPTPGNDAGAGADGVKSRGPIGGPPVGSRNGRGGGGRGSGGGALNADQQSIISDIARDRTDGGKFSL